MIRPLTFICLLAAFGSGLYLYQEKHSAILVDHDIARLIHATQAARERTGLLRAEWALLNDPGRLQEMSDKYLQLKPMAPGQFVQLAELSTRLPPVPPPAPPPPPEGATPDAAAPADDAAGPAGPVAEDMAPDEPAVVAKAEPPPAPAPVHVASKQVARLAPRKAARPAAVAEREYHDGPLAHGTPLPLAGLPAPSARMMSAMARPVRLAQARPAVMTAYPSSIGTGTYAGSASRSYGGSGQGYGSASTYVGSALAGGSSLPPPVPLR